MARTTRSDDYDTSPRPIGQSFWLFATVAIAAVMLATMGDALTAARGSADQPIYSGQELLELASPTMNPTEMTAVSPSQARSDQTTIEAPRATIPAAPSLNAENVTATTEPTNPPTSTQTEPATTTSEAAPATPETTEPPGHQAQGEAALAAISYPWEQLLPGWTITFLPEKNGLYGLTKVPEERIEIYVRKDQSRALLAHVIAHELGHAVDVTLNDGPDRRRWEEARGLSSSPWWPGSGATDFSTGAGDFAESFAAWQVGDQSFRSELSGAPSPAQIELLAELSAS